MLPSEYPKTLDSQDLAFVAPYVFDCPVPSVSLEIDDLYKMYVESINFVAQYSQQFAHIAQDLFNTQSIYLGIPIHTIQVAHEHLRQEFLARNPINPGPTVVIDKTVERAIKKADKLHSAEDHATKMRFWATRREIVAQAELKYAAAKVQFKEAMVIEEKRVADYKLQWQQYLEGLKSDIIKCKNLTADDLAKNE